MPQTPFEFYRNKVRRKDWHPDEYQEEAVHDLQRLHDELIQPQKGFFKKRKTPKGVYLWGGVGRGKSMLMDMFFDTLPAAVSRRRVHFHEFMIETHDYLHKARQGNDSDSVIPDFAKKVSKETKLICFDEFHVTDVADAMILSRLFTALFKYGTVMVATSNWPPDRLYEGGLQRELFLPFINLLKEKTNIIEVNGATDYRLQCLSDSGVYFSPLGAAAQKQTDNVFRHLTDGAAPYTEVLSVKGRSIKVPVVAKGVARFTFAQLCEQPLGAEDYLMIARNYHTVFLEDVPRLKYDRRNEAKRLMILIDTLYDQKTKLVVTADAPPDELYAGRDHAFEFQRTVSRLIEMQTMDYLTSDT